MQQKKLYFFLLSTLSITLLFYFFLLSQQNLYQKNCHKIKIVCTTTLIADAIKHIAGESVECITLMGPGVDPHTYKPVETDIFNIAQADIIFYHGLHLEARMSDLFDTMQTYKTTIAVSESIPKELLIFDTEFTQHPDPHIWFDPEVWIYAIKTIAFHLQQKNSTYTEMYQTNFEKYLLDIAQTHQNNKGLIAKIPLNQRILITGHDAFSYFARAYQFKVYSLQGINTASQAGTKDIANIITIIINNHIHTIFPENSIPIRNILSLTQATDLMGQSVNIGSELFSDSLGAANTAQSTYVGMIRSNVYNIVNGLL